MLAEGESLSQHAAAAAQRALDMARINAADVDLIILATSSPDDLFGSACGVTVRFEAQKLFWGNLKFPRSAATPCMPARAYNPGSERAQEALLEVLPIAGIQGWMHLSRCRR